MNKRVHKINPNNFCYEFEQFIGSTKRNFTATFQEAFWKYFQTNYSDIQNQFTRFYICSVYHRNTQHEEWFNFAVATNVLGNDITEDWKEKFDRLIFSLKVIGCPAKGIKIYSIFKFKDKCEAYVGIFSVEYGERLHKEM